MIFKYFNLVYTLAWNIQNLYIPNQMVDIYILPINFNTEGIVAPKFLQPCFNLSQVLVPSLFLSPSNLPCWLSGKQEPNRVWWPVYTFNELFVTTLELQHSNWYSLLISFNLVRSALAWQ